MLQFSPSATMTDVYRPRLRESFWAASRSSCLPLFRRSTHERSGRLNFIKNSFRFKLLELDELHFLFQDLSASIWPFCACFFESIPAH